MLTITVPDGLEMEAVRALKLRAIMLEADLDLCRACNSDCLMLPAIQEKAAALRTLAQVILAQLDGIDAVLALREADARETW